MKGHENRLYKGIPVGLTVQRDIGKTDIYRVRRGSGVYGTILGETVQDKYDYFVPGSINNAESEPYRRQWIAAVHKWRFDLTAEQKKEYDDRAGWRLKMSGYNLFMREAMKGEVEMFVDRGDPVNYDWREFNLTLDNAFHDLDMSAIVPAGAKAVLLRTGIKDDIVGRIMVFRTKGNISAPNEARIRIQTANVAVNQDNVVIPDSDRFVEYRISAGVDIITLTVAGWWT